MVKKIFRIAVALTLALSMCLVLCQCGGDGDSPTEGGAQEVSVSLQPVSTTAAPGESVTVRATVKADGSAVSDPASAGLSLVWSAEPGDADLSSDSTGLVETVTPKSAGVYTVKAEVRNSAGETLASGSMTVNVREPEEIPDPVTAGLYVPFVTADEDFIRGTDVSSLLVVLNSGARFKDWDGSSLGESVEENGANFMKLLAEAGCNWVRLRVWNDPYDENGKGYGGGNNDLSSAVTMGKWATDAGIRVLIDFHYSDFWADPSRQLVPKAWEGMDIDEKAKALADFTTESLNTLLDAGVDVGMVQVGNETTVGICGETQWPNMLKLYNAGCDAVHAVGQAHGREIMTCVHMESPQSADFHSIAQNLRSGGVQFDVFATSYYPQWHGTIENMASKLKDIAETFGVKVMVAETRAPYTADDGDGSNSNAPAEYAISPQGQALEYAAVAEAIHDIGQAGIGLFYWENAWIPVRNISNLTGAERDAAIEENKRIWDECGSGWASSYAQDYDPNAANGGYGGPDMNNKAMFDFDGVPLESLNVFKYMTTGTAGYPDRIVDVPTVSLTLTVGDTVELPTTLEVGRISGKRETVPVTWQDSSYVKTTEAGYWEVKGWVEDGGEKVWTFFCVTVNRPVVPSLLSNGDFESGNQGYTVENWPGDGINNLSANAGNVHGGSWCLHFWKDSAFENAVTSTKVTLEPGTYTFYLFGQGGNMGENNTYIFVRTPDGELKEQFWLDGYQNWQVPEITFTLTAEAEVTLGVSVTAGAGAWGSFDDWTLFKTE